MSGSKNMMGMFNADAMMNRMFRKVEDVVWDMSTGKVGVRTADGISTLEGEGEAAQITTNMLDTFGMNVPAFAQSTAAADVKLGDMILQANDKPAWIIGRREHEDKAHAAQIALAVADGAVATPVRTVISFELMRADGTRTTWRPPKVQMIGFDGGGVMVVRSLLSMLPGGAGGLGQMQNMLMMTQMMGGGDMDMEKLMPMMLMSQMGGMGALTGAAPAEGGMNSMMQMMMMPMLMKAMGGASKVDPDDYSPVRRSPFGNR